jgi:hypothetical protein
MGSVAELKFSECSRRKPISLVTVRIKKGACLFNFPVYTRDMDESRALELFTNCNSYSHWGIAKVRKLLQL